MRIGIDARLWRETGVGRYIRNLTKNLLEIEEKNSYILFVTKEDLEEIKKELGAKPTYVTANSRWHSLDEQINFPKIIDRQKVDLMHFPYFSVPIFYKKPFVVTIHDLILHHFPTGEASTLPLWLYGFKMLAYRLVIRNAARNSKKIITVSNSTKREIVDHLRVDPKKVEIIYEAADDFGNLKKLEDKSVNLGNYFLYVGNVYPHKNVEKLIKAFNSLTSENLKLVFVGKEDFFYEKLRKKLGKFEGEGKIIFMFDVDDNKLTALYKNAIALVRPSLMEGFSLPPLEAMACRCLVLASDIAVHREIFGDSLIYFDPRNVYDIVSKMQEVLSLPENKKKEFTEKGTKKASEFSWRKAAQRTLEVYEGSLSL